MPIKIQVKLPKNLPNSKSMAKGVRNALIANNTRIRNSFLREYESGTKSGRMYGSHRASAPNETPAKITGNQGNAIITVVSGFTAGIGNSSPYAKFPEFGTKKMQPRRGLRQAIDKNLGSLEKDLEDIKPF